MIVIHRCPPSNEKTSDNCEGMMLLVDSLGFAICRLFSKVRYFNSFLFVICNQGKQTFIRSPQHERQYSTRVLIFDTLSHALTHEGCRSGVPVVHVRSTVFIEPFFSSMAASSIAKDGSIRFLFGSARTSPISPSDVARVVSTILEDPIGHRGKVYELTGPRSEWTDMSMLSDMRSKI